MDYFQSLKSLCEIFTELHQCGVEKEKVVCDGLLHSSRVKEFLDNSYVESSASSLELKDNNEPHEWALQVAKEGNKIIEELFTKSKSSNTIFKLHTILYILYRKLRKYENDHEIDNESSDEDGDD